ncbi:MAG: hypothetical protein H7228_12685 [Polaromonas sp.]|nr:hypothetical protein [Polaromonas sp.]
MNSLKSKYMTTAVLALVASAALVACGGGSSSSTAALAPPAATVNLPQVDAVVAASDAVVTSIGASLIAGAADEEIYNVTADIGDSWQLVFNNKTNTYVTKVLSTQFGLTQSASAAFTKTTVGTTTSIKDAGGTALSVQIDTRTRTLSGKVTLGAKTATVAGSGYAVTDTSKLAGTYFYGGSTRDLSGANRSADLGSFTLAANGDVVLCEGGIFAGSSCVKPVDSTSLPTKALKVTRDSSGLLRVKDPSNLDFGALHVSSGDRGAILVLDRFGKDASGISRTGVIFASKASVKLAGTEFNGTWVCSVGGKDVVQVVATDSTLSLTDLELNKPAAAGTLSYNKVVTGLGSASAREITLDGVISAKNNGEAVGESVVILPLSSSLAIVVEPIDNIVDVCRKKS